MNRYIDVNRFKKFLELKVKQKLISWETADSTIGLIEKYAPTANVKPIVRGKWEYDNAFSLPYCSNCAEINKNGETAFCPHCGADMRGENNA